ncbi:hypothetical protein P2318_15350 [Myxococcaceae bacterium GXIMD 01537]
MKAVLGGLMALLLAAEGKPGGSPTRLRTTQGTLRQEKEGQQLVESPKMRAVTSGVTGPITELRFTYLGPTAEKQPLASGELRQQLGLKLRAQDGCNVVYVMWRLEPKPGLVVSVKNNPGQHTSSECGNRGYSTVRPRKQAPLPPLKPGASHVLRAELQGRALRVRVDGASVWEGELPPEALAFDGPPGVRTDNARVELRLITASDETAAP